MRHLLHKDFIVIYNLDVVKLKAAQNVFLPPLNDTSADNGKQHLKTSPEQY